MRVAGQIALPLAPVGQPRFVLGAGNRTVVAALGDPARWPYRTALLAGPARSGRSTLGRWFVAQGLGDAIDDAERERETALFHRWNACQAAGTPLLLIGPEGGWRIALPDLASRIGAALTLTITPPDDAMFAELLVAHAARRGCALSPDGAAYLAARAERTYRNAEALVAALDRLSLERKAAPGPALWRDALDALNAPTNHGLC